MTPDTDVNTLSTESHGGWDSIAHLNLILAVEQEFPVHDDPRGGDSGVFFPGDAGPGREPAMSRGTFSLRLDVDSVICLEEGVPNLLRAG